MKRQAGLKRTALKQGDKGLSRKTALKRGAPLKPSAEPQRGEPLARSSPLRRVPPKRHDPVAVMGFHHAVCTVPSRHGPRPAKCIVCGTKARLDPHHVIPKNWLWKVERQLGLAEGFLGWDPRNGVPVCRDDHDAHELAARRISRHLLPAAVWEFAHEIDTALGTYAATERLNRSYPA